jgi:excisionase family DNA binding protein
VASVSAIVDALLAELDDDALDALAERLAPRLAEHLGAEGSPWLNADEAARYIAGPKGRVYDLVQLGKLTPGRDGRRLVFRRADLDAYLDASA